jgi:hypothetical protein
MIEEFRPNYINVVAQPSNSGNTTLTSGYSIESPALGQFIVSETPLKDIITQSNNGVPYNLFEIKSGRPSVAEVTLNTPILSSGGRLVKKDGGLHVPNVSAPSVITRSVL